MSDQEQRGTLDLDENGCAPDCPIRILGEQSGERKSNTTSTRGRGSAIYANGKGFANTLQEVGQSIGYGDTGTASRYFKTFRPMVDDPDDETPQERGETQLLKSDEVKSGDLPIDQVIHGDALEVLKRLPSNSCHAMVVDPPSSIHFMGKEWDNDKGGRDQWIAWLASVMREALRCLLPGAHAFVWALPRTSHMTGMALENAGFEIRDEVSHLFGPDSRVQPFMASLDSEQRNAFAQIMDSMGAPAVTLACFGSGFPKSLSVSAAIDKHFKAEREVIGPGQWANRGIGINGPTFKHDTSTMEGRNITAPATDLAKKYSGFGSALKPSHENWLLVRKPLAEKTIAAQVLATGTGAINVDASRIGLNGDDTSRKPVSAKGWKNSSTLNGTIDDNWQKGRFPSNTLFSHSPACVALGEKRVRGTAPPGRPSRGTLDPNTRNAYGKFEQINDYLSYTGEDGCETVAAYSCAPDCPVRVLDQQSGVLTNGGGVRTTGTTRNVYTPGMEVSKAGDIHASYGDKGGASRYFKTFPPIEDMVPFTYQSKASRRERNEGCEALPLGDVHRYGAGVGRDDTPTSDPHRPVVEGNYHPTVKSLSLMSYLIRMITPSGGIVLDMFGGSGSTGVAAVQCGFHYILIEQEAEYVDIIRARLAHAHAGSPSRREPVRSQRITSMSRSIAKCPEHDVSQSKDNRAVYKCGCKTVYTHDDRDTTPAPVRSQQASQRIAGWGKKVAQCPTHGNPVPSESSRDAYGLNCYTCGCDLVYTKANTTPAPHQRPVDTRPTLWEVQE